MGFDILGCIDMILKLIFKNARTIDYYFKYQRRRFIQAIFKVPIKLYIIPSFKFLFLLICKILNKNIHLKNESEAIYFNPLINVVHSLLDNTLKR